MCPCSVCSSRRPRRPPPRADSTAQSLPFQQDWSNTALIAADDNWSGVPGIVGYRGDGLTGGTGVNPQTVVGEGTAPVVDVIANQLNPNTLATGGVAEFHLAGTRGPVVALQGSGTARAPHLVVTISTVGLSNVTVSYVLRDVDGSTDNAIQPVALQYRVGTSGDYTNVPAAFVADATSGPSLATLETPVSVTLPAAVDNQPVVQVRAITTDAVGSDEWVGIDDIVVQANAIPQPTSPTAVGTATPASVQPGDDTVLTVTVTPGQNPSSTGLTVTGDLSAIGGSVAQPFQDDGLSQDGAAGDNVFAFRATVAAGTTPGSKSLPIAVSDAEGRTGSATIALGITAPVAGNVVISQVYGGGGNSGAVYTHDFIELYNRGSEPASLAGWSVQYAAAAGSTWQRTLLAGTIAPGTYYLVQQAAGSGGTDPLPAPDAIGTITMAATAGKVALVSSPALLTGTCPTGSAIVDFVGYGSTANCSEGNSPAPALSNTTAAIRAGSGTIDTNNNAADFAAGEPTPHNSDGIPPGAAGVATPAAVQSGGSTLLTVAVTPGSIPASSTFTVVADLTGIGGALQALFDDGLNGDVQAGDLIYSRLVTVPGDPGFRSVPATVTDDLDRTASTTIRLAVEQTVTLPIATIQGNGSASSYTGQFVTTSGIVTGLRPNGFYIQSPDDAQDGNGLTSEGLFIFTAGAGLTPAAGDSVRVSGFVSEFALASIAFARPTTEISGDPAIVVASQGHALPGVVDLLPAHTPGDDFEALERFEGMRVRANLEVIAPTDGGVNEATASSTSNGVFFAVIRGVARPAREPGIDPAQVVPPGTLDTVPRFDGNPERLRVDSDGRGGPALEVAAGQTIDGMIAIVDHGGTTYTLLPDPAASTPAGAASAIPVQQPGANEFTVASFNLERLFDDVNDPGGDPVLSSEALQRRLQKASLAIRDVMRMPDILGIEEAEKLSTLEALASRINADAVGAAGGDPAANPLYVARLVEGNDIGGIDVGVLVKSARVDILSVTQVGKDTTYDPIGAAEPDLLNDRPPLVLEASVRGPNGAAIPLTVIVNHLRSLIGIDDPEDGARVRQKRKLQAEFLAGYVQSRQAATPGERIVLVGDFNAYEFNDGFVDVIGAIKGTPAPAAEVVLPAGAAAPADRVLTNLVETVSTAQRYSYVFDGNTQVLDHVLANGPAHRRFSRLQYARNNADFPESLRNDSTRPERLSDHDMPVAYFVFFGAPVVTLNGDATMTVEAFEPFSDPGAAAFDEILGPLPVSVSGAVDPNTPGTYTLSYSASNGFQTTTVSRIVHVVDGTAPAIQDFAVTPDRIGPPNHEMIPVSVVYSTFDASGQVSCTLTVASNEVANGRGDGNTEIDWQVLDAHQVRLRAERSGTGAGRVYTVTATCADPAGNTTARSAAVTVPR